jgi:hypothetical protein
MKKIAVPGRNSKSNDIVGQIRIGDLNKLFALRYGNGPSDCGWTFPDDDAGLEDLKILIHTYRWTNPLSMPRIIRLRAPWADVQAILDEVDAYPRSWKSATLGQLLNFGGGEWRRLRTRTVAPVDMTAEDRRDFSRILANGQRRAKRARRGMKTRAEYEANSLSRTKPWVAEGISRRTWYRRQKENGRGTGLAAIKITMDMPDLCQQVGDVLLPSQGMGSVATPPRCSPTHLPAPPEQCQDPNFNPILSWLCLRTVYHQEMSRICDRAAIAA